MSESIKKVLENGDGMAIYDYVVNNPDIGIDHLEPLVRRLRQVDSSGQFLASTARFLSAINPEGYREIIPELLNGAIEKDKERKYIGSLLEAIWGKGYEDRAEELRESDSCFRKIYQRIFERSVNA